jgi:hypothetical protein
LHKAMDLAVLIAISWPSLQIKTFQSECSCAAG